MTPRKPPGRRRGPGTPARGTTGRPAAGAGQGGAGKGRAGKGRAGKGVVGKGSAGKPRTPASSSARSPKRSSSSEPRRANSTPGLGGERVEGRQAVRELLLAGRRRVREIHVADDLERAPILEDIFELAAEANVPVRRVPRRKLDAEAQTDAPQGVIARAEPVDAVALDDLFDSVAGPPFLLALDGVTDPHNVGALLRSADGAGVTGIILPKHRAARLSATVCKAAAGAVEHLRIAHVAGIPTALSEATKAGLWVVGLDGAGDVAIDEVAANEAGIVIVAGAEGSGLARLTRERCDVLARIPLVGALDSLNVSVAGAVALFSVARSRRPDDGMNDTV